jgi:hypothetical protein
MVMEQIVELVVDHDHLFSLCASCSEYELSLESIPKYAPLDVMVSIIVVNCLFCNFP